MPEEPTMESQVIPEEIVLQVVPVAPVTHEAATLDGAFMQLCEAMSAYFDANDDMPSATHADEIVGWYANGNHGIAWAHAVLLLEQVIQVPLRGNT